MPLDPRRPIEDWHTRLREQARRSWGQERATEIDGALERMARAIARVAARTPRADVVPGSAAPSSRGREAGGGG